MSRHSEGFEAKAVERVNPTNACGAADVHREAVVSRLTLHAWLRELPRPVLVGCGR